MVDYLDYTNAIFYIFSGLTIFSALLLKILDLASNYEEGGKNYKSSSIVATIVFTFGVTMPFVNGYQNYTTITENIKQFRDAKSLECYSGANSYLVSKQRGWELDGEQFLKGDLLMSVLRCSLREGK